MAPKRERIALGTIVARLEQVLDLKNKELAKEMANNRAAKASRQLLECLRLAGLGLQEVMARDAPDADAFWGMADPPVLADLDNHARALLALLASDCSASASAAPTATHFGGSSGGSGSRSGRGGAGGLATGGGPADSAGAASEEGRPVRERSITVEAAPQVNAGEAAAADAAAAAEEEAPAAQGGAREGNQAAGEGSEQGTEEGGEFDDTAAGMSTSRFLKRIVAMQYVELDRPAFIALWRTTVRELALALVHAQAGSDDAVRQLQEAISKASIVYAGHFLSKPWAPTLLPLNLETGESGDAPQSRWERVASCMSMTQDQALLYSVIHEWWKATAATLNEERQWLMAQAAEAPQDAVLADEAAAGLERINGAYVRSAVSAMVVMLSTFQTVVQAAEVNVQSYPSVPLLTAILDALARMNKAAA